MTQKELPNGNGKPNDRIDDAADDLHSTGGVGPAGDLDDVGSDDGIPPWTDAGVSEEAQEAEKRTERAVLRLAEDRLSADEAIEAARGERDLVKRAKALVALEAISYPEKKAVRTGDMMVMQASNSDVNRWAAFDALFGDGDERPHLDTFSGRLVDHEGEVFDDRYPVVELVRALTVAGLSSQSAEVVRKSFKDWALQTQRNDLIDYIEKTMPQWDGTPRMDTRLIQLFDPLDTPLNRMVGRYFWLSVYARIMFPGCMAPVVLSLFGAQNAGKSYFAKLICQTITGDKDADSVQLDVDAPQLDFLREITGNSIIANIGEMTGMARADLNKVKNFITRTSDKMHYKYEGHFNQNRQWVIVMDGNDYEGFQRDTTGNRRFYPMFVGQLEDKHGKPHWDDTFKADFTGFKEDIWQIMAEARAWFEANGGLSGYGQFTDKVSAEVAAFNKREMRNDRGTIRDDLLDMHLRGLLLSLTPDVLDGSKNKGIFIPSADIDFAFRKRTRRDMNPRHLKPKMEALGFEAVSAGRPLARGFILRDVMSMDDYRAAIMGDAEEVVKVSGQREADKGNDDGF